MQVSTFNDLGKVFWVSPHRRKEKPFYCRKCGGEMLHIPGTNVLLCENIKGDGTQCDNRVLSSRAF